MQFIVIGDREIFIQQLVHVISVFNYVCLNGCHPPEMQGCWHWGRLVKLLTFCLPGRKFVLSFLRVFQLFPFTNSRICGATHP